MSRILGIDTGTNSLGWAMPLKDLGKSKIICIFAASNGINRYKHTWQKTW